MRFIKYWIENIKSAKEWYDWILFLLPIVITVTGAILFILNNTKTVQFTSDEIEKSGVVGVIVFVICLAWIPYRRHEELQKMHSDLESKLASHAKDKNRPQRNQSLQETLALIIDSEMSFTNAIANYNSESNVFRLTKRGFRTNLVKLKESIEKDGYLPSDIKEDTDSFLKNCLVAFDTLEQRHNLPDGATKDTRDELNDRYFSTHNKASELYRAVIKKIKDRINE